MHVQIEITRTKMVADPVEIQLPQEGEGNQIHVTNASEEYLKMARHPAYKDSTLVQNAAVASRFIVTTSGFLANVMTSGADSFTKKTKPNPKPMTFTPATQARVRKLHSLSQGAVGLSAKTVGQVSKYAQNFGAAMAGRGGKSNREQKDYKPGLLNKSMMAYSTVADGIDYASRNLLASGSSAATTVVGHRYGEEARKVVGELAGGVKNVGLVYVDASGVSRRALIKSTAKGMVWHLLTPQSSIAKADLRTDHWQSSRRGHPRGRSWRRWPCTGRGNSAEEIPNPSRE